MPATQIQTFDNITTRFCAYVQGHELGLGSDGSVVSQASRTRQGQVQVLSAQNGPGSLSGTCGTNGTQFCPQAWNEGLLGPIPGAPPNVTDIVNSTASTNLPVCGNKCSGPQECGPSDSDHDCSCAYPSPEHAIKLGFDPLFPAAVCLVLAAGSLLGRDLPTYVDSRGVPYKCRCNQTFAANECCGPKDGMVWVS